ncbi:4-alpha-glucanotransferase [Streptomyces sp. NBC_00237]|uniref:4-alpha-glucanotransferase n=1 Tax=Streptomyces sp. NBC_00237 TaxID=2975687 RepID=UPI00225B7A63|nr:4-alpha-glucanotransferase [Streptomyces sp. NBC_00237]MCX5201195.1 4-alpha-glucanotransferase [Streptomyces sp. NBC_00237]
MAAGRTTPEEPVEPVAEPASPAEPSPPEPPPVPAPLARLAALYGVAVSYSPSADRTVHVPAATAVAVLAALDVDASTPEAVDAALAAHDARARTEVLPPTLVLWRGAQTLPEALAALPEGTELRVATEQGEARTWPAPPPAHRDGPAATGASGHWAQLPHGVHRLSVRLPDGREASCHLVVAPARAKAPEGPRHGFLVQLYSLLSTRSWGMGDLGDLADLAAWAGRFLGAGFLQVNPLHAAVPGTPTDPSPYRPSTRRFPDPVHLRIEDVPEFGYVTDPADRTRLGELLAEAAALREGVLLRDALLDRDAVWALKREALTIVAGVPLSPGRRAAYCDFLAEQGTALEDHATWLALVDLYGPDRTRWPGALADRDSADTARERAKLGGLIDFHCRAVWLTDCQLAAAQRAAREAGMAVGLVHDLAVGVHPDGSDTWAQAHAYAPGMSVGAPPDAFNARGQDWGLPPWRPDVLAATGYAPYRSLLRNLLRHAGAVRIDHVMGLFRLWWVPAGLPPTEGAYVRYDAEAMLAVLVLEADRAGAVVVGEDLGTVEPGVRDALAARGVLGTSVLWFERDWAGTGRPLPPEAWREGCVATATTHDLPSTAARLTGDHVALRHRLGLLTRPLARERAEEATEVTDWLSYLTRLGLLPEGGEDEEAAVRAVHRFLLRTPARMVGIWLPDAVGDRRPQNLPGTWDQYPNWRLPLADATGRPLTLEELAASPRLHALVEAIREASDSGAHAGADAGAEPLTAPPGERPA